MLQGSQAFLGSKHLGLEQKPGKACLRQGLCKEKGAFPVPLRAAHLSLWALHMLQYVHEMPLILLSPPPNGLQLSLSARDAKSAPIHLKAKPTLLYPPPP